MPRRSASAVADTRASVLDTAIRTASVEGLEGLTIGGLAGDVEMSKSGLFGLFGSKEDLQRATLRAGIDLFVREVWEPVAGEPAGRKRLLALCDRWIAFHEREVLPGGCFMTTAIVEFDARPGPVRDAVSRVRKRWLGLLETDAKVAIEAGELPARTDPADLAFTLDALASSASCDYRLTGDPRVLKRARRIMQRALDNSHVDAESTSEISP